MESQPEIVNPGIINEYELNFMKVLDDIDEKLIKAYTINELQNILLEYLSILKQYPNSHRALYGVARVYDIQAEIEKSNTLLDKSIKYYVQLSNMPEISDSLFYAVIERCHEQMLFRGMMTSACGLLQMGIKRFPNDVKLRNKLGVCFLMKNEIEKSRFEFEEVLNINPNNGFAKVHLGFILKGIQSKEPGVIDGRFYFHLSDALYRLGETDEKINLEAEKLGVFLSQYQRSLYNVNRLTAKPWWTINETSYYLELNNIKNKWKIIKDDILGLLNDHDTGFEEESENLLHYGGWKQLELWARELNAATSCTRGQIKVSILQPNSHVWAHTGPTNCRIRGHLGIIIPDKVFLRVHNEIRQWKEGEWLIFDDSFEHEVWHNGTSQRIVLIVDMWHPELTKSERKSLPPI